MPAERVILEAAQAVTTTSHVQIGTAGGGSPALQVTLEEGNNYVIRVFVNYIMNVTTVGVNFGWLSLNGLTFSSVRWLHRIYRSGTNQPIPLAGLLTNLTSAVGITGFTTGFAEHIVYLTCDTTGQLAPTVALSSVSDVGTLVNLSTYIEKDIV